MKRAIWRITITVEAVDEGATLSLETTEGTETETPGLTDFYSVAEVANLLDVSRRTVYRLIQLGQLQSRQVARRRMIHRDDVKAYLAAARDPS